VACSGAGGLIGGAHRSSLAQAFAAWVSRHGGMTKPIAPGWTGWGFSGEEPSTWDAAR
jgi:hypothetical protein